MKIIYLFQHTYLINQIISTFAKKVKRLASAFALIIDIS